jgi:hypothetical protein
MSTTVTGAELLAFDRRTSLERGVQDAPQLRLLCLQSVAARRVDDVTVSVEAVPREVDKFTDTIFMLWPEAPDRVTVRPMRGTISPGAYYTQKDPHPLGAANLTYGLHLYVRGPHRGRMALRAFGEINRIWRDRDGDYAYDLDEQIVEGKFGVNIHPGGRSDYIGRWSAGCINIWGGWEGADWKALTARLDQYLPLTVDPGRRGPFVVVKVWRGSDFFRWHAQDAAGREQFLPTIFPGNRGPWAHEIQVHLNRHSYRIRMDGDWRGATTRAVVAFQRASGLKPDGVVGPRTWAALKA